MTFFETLRGTFVGRAKTVIDIKRSQNSQVGGGFSQSGWTSIYPQTARPKAIWVNAYGAEAITAASLQYDEAATVTVRYRPDINTACQVYRKGDKRPFRILSMDNVEDRNKFISLKIARAVTSG